MNPAELEALIDREIRTLPAPRAPHTLLPLVMASVHQWTMRPWYARAWFTWPMGWQMVSIAALMLLVAGGALLMPGARAAASQAASSLASGVVDDVTVMARRAELTVNAARVLWRTVLEPFVAYAFAIVVLMCLACAAFATTLNRLAFGRTLPS